MNEKMTGCILKKHCGFRGNFAFYGEATQNLLFTCPDLDKQTLVA
jgi:hypothetical protein